MKTEYSLTFILWSVLLLIGVLPIVWMLYHLFTNLETLDLASFTGALTAFFNSLLLALSVATLTTLTGTALGVLFAKSDLPFKGLFLILLIIPLLIPPYILALGWIDMLGVKGWLGTFLFGFGGTTWVLFAVYLPIPILMTFFFLQQVNSSLEESARLFVEEKQVLRYILLPLIKPAILLSFILVFILTFGEYSVANVLRYRVFALESFTQFSAFYDFKAAIVMSLPMLIIALVVILVERFYIQKHLFSYQNTQRHYQIKLSTSLKKRFTVLVLFLVGIIVIVPILGLFKEVHAWHYFLTALDKAALPLLHSTLFGLMGALLLMVFGFFFAYILISKKYRGANILDTVLLFLFVLPSTVIAIALIYFWNTPYTQFVYTTPLIIFMAYLAKYLLLTTKITQTKLRLIPSSMIEAAQLSGATVLQTLRYILVPLSKKVLFVSFLVGLIFSLRESTLTMMLYPPGLETLPIYISTQMANGEPQIIASLCLLMILLILIPLVVLLFTFRRDHDTL